MGSNYISGAEIVIRCLHEEKVKFVFGYPHADSVKKCVLEPTN
jgi:thiamine pyrophosphate-dependent acetolactate synthase large subunit-like protein